MVSFQNHVLTWFPKATVMMKFPNHFLLIRNNRQFNLVLSAQELWKLINIFSCQGVSDRTVIICEWQGHTQKMKRAGPQSSLQMCSEEAVRASCCEASTIRLLLFETQSWHQFPGAAVTKSLKRGAFKQQKFTRKQPKCLSTDEWIKKMWYVYTKGYYCCYC